MSTSASEEAAGLDRRISDSVAAYDAVASEYQEHWRQYRPRDAMRKFGRLAGPGARILDVACGPGVDVRGLRDAGVKVVAGDLSHEAMRVAKLLHPKGALARWDFRRLPFADDTFEGVWAPAALQHVARRHMRAQLRELRRVHRSGPIFVSFRQGRGDLEPVEDPPAGTVYATTMIPDELKALLLDAGYAEVEVEQRPDLLGRSAVTWVHGWGRLPAS